MKTKNLLVPAICLGLTLVACVNAPSVEGSGSATIAALTTDDVDAIQVTVTGPAITAPIVSNLSKDPGTGAWSGVIPDIPIGNNTFLAEAFEAGVLVYSGSVTTDMLEAQQISVTIFLQQVTPPDPFANTVPSFQSLVISPSDPAPNEDVTLTVVATDPDVGDSITLLWNSPVGSFDVTDQAIVVWTAPPAEGTHAVTVSATDNSGATASLTASIAVQTPTGDALIDINLNTWPVASNLVPNPTRIEVGETTQLDLTAADPDGDLLTYSWSADCTGTFSDATAEDPSFTLDVDNADAPCALTVTIGDGNGGATDATVTIATGTSVQPQGLDCNDLVCTFSVATSSFTNYFVPSPFNPPSETAPFGGSVNIDCEPNGDQCGCTAEYTDTIGPLPVPGIGEVCLVPMPAGQCPTGTIACAPGVDQNIAHTQTHNIGACTDNPGCRASCDSYCASQGAVRVENSPACEGFCRASDIPMCWGDDYPDPPDPGFTRCPPGDTCDELGANTGHDGYCGCQCVDISDGTPSGPGEGLLHIGWAVNVLFDNDGDGIGELGLGLDGLPCTADDEPLGTLPPTCVPFTTSTASALLPDAGWWDNVLPYVPIDGVINPPDTTGAPFTCSGGVPSAASGAVLQGVGSYKDTRRYDFATMLTIQCE